MRKVLLINGIVQGVGFRPFIYRLAKRYSLKGKVRNEGKGVYIEVEGDEENIERFLRELRLSPPPPCEITSMEEKNLPDAGYEDFVIEKSKEEEPFTFVSPDIATCKDCLRELFDPQDRRYLYPFINCTNCGPRFTIVESLPYDRERTTMRIFKMCPECEQEYNDPLSRRFHAQPNACPECGPEVFLLYQGKRIKENAIEKACELIEKGLVVAIKGLGGFHLAVDARNPEAVKRLRERKRKNNKPFALMGNPEDIEKHCELSEEERAVLLSPQAPIVLLRKKPSSTLPEEIAPGQAYLGFMVPYTPLHHILMRRLRFPIVLTSANYGDEPIIKEENETLEKLSDAILTHTRPIHARCDDSVLSVVDKNPYFVRRSRGYAPKPLKLPFSSPCHILALGGMLKNTFTMIKEDFAFVSHHIGDVSTYETEKFLLESIEHYKKLFAINPELVVCDLHPGYPTTRIAEEMGLPLVKLQHHKAHILSLMAEQGIEEEIIGVSFDGTGYGEDGRIWGGEFFVGDVYGLERAGHLRYIPLPGGDRAVEQPWRMKAVLLYEIYGDDAELTEKEKNVVELIKKGINVIETSSAGRIFDGVASLLGICNENTFEGEAPMRLEALSSFEEENYEFSIEGEVLDLLPGIKEMVEDPSPVPVRGGRFHRTVALGVVEFIKRIKKSGKVLLSGGVFQNRLLLKHLVPLLKREGYEPILHTKVPPNDGGISLGQAYFAGRKGCASVFR